MKRDSSVKKYLRILAVVVLLSLGACLFIEPALAFTHNETECADNNDHCCFICNSSQHQWKTSDSAAFVSPPEIIINLSAVKLHPYSYSTPISIFRPPSVSLRI